MDEESNTLAVLKDWPVSDLCSSVGSTSAARCFISPSGDVTNTALSCIAVRTCVAIFRRAAK